jgi:hypothetical protein
MQQNPSPNASKNQQANDFSFIITKKRTKMQKLPHPKRRRRYRYLTQSLVMSLFPSKDDEKSENPQFHH